MGISENFQFATSTSPNHRNLKDLIQYLKRICKGAIVYTGLVHDKNKAPAGISRADGIMKKFSSILQKENKTDSIEEIKKQNNLEKKQVKKMFPLAKLYTKTCADRNIPLTLINSAVRYNPTNALTLARISEMAYADPEGFIGAAKIALKYTPKTAFLDDPASGMFFHVLKIGKNVVCCFRGSEKPGVDKKDWETNLNYMPNTYLSEPRYSMEMHRGYYFAFKKNYPLMIEKINSLRKQGDRVWITGHSAGGAYAQILAWKLEKDKKIKIYQIYTFGQPAIVHKSLANDMDRFFREKYFRVVNKTDIVPVSIPRYDHVGTACWIDLKNNVRVSTITWDEVQKLIKERTKKDWTMSAHWKNKGNLLGDHMPDKYVEGLKKKQVYEK